MFTAPLFATAKTWKQPEYLSTEWVKKIWYIYTVACYSAIKKNEMMSFAATWMNLIIILNEIGQEKKDKSHMISLLCQIF